MSRCSKIVGARAVGEGQITTTVRMERRNKRKGVDIRAILRMVTSKLKLLSGGCACVGTSQAQTY